MTGVYKAISAVQSDLARIGIAKDRKNKQQNYSFRGIDDVYAALSPLLAQHGLVVIPRLIERDQVERTSQNGGSLFYTTVKAEFDFVAVEDGTVHTASTYGEAMDSGDKSTNKAMSAAYKYAAFMTFAIPTEGDNDADSTTHEVAPRRQSRDDPTPNKSEVITPAQRAELMTLAAAKNIDARRLCEVGKISSISEMPASVFGQAKAWLEKQPRRELEHAGYPSTSDLIDDDIPY